MSTNSATRYSDPHRAHLKRMTRAFGVPTVITTAIGLIFLIIPFLPLQVLGGMLFAAGVLILASIGIVWWTHSQPADEP